MIPNAYIFAILEKIKLETLKTPKDGKTEREREG